MYSLSSTIHVVIDCFYAVAVIVVHPFWQFAVSSAHFHEYNVGALRKYGGFTYEWNPIIDAFHPILILMLMLPIDVSYYSNQSPLLCVHSVFRFMSSLTFNSAALSLRSLIG